MIHGKGLGYGYGWDQINGLLGFRIVIQSHLEDVSKKSRDSRVIDHHPPNLENMYSYNVNCIKTKHLNVGISDNESQRD